MNVKNVKNINCNIVTTWWRCGVMVETEGDYNIRDKRDRTSHNCFVCHNFVLCFVLVYFDFSLKFFVVVKVCYPYFDLCFCLVVHCWLPLLFQPLLLYNFFLNHFSFACFAFRFWVLCCFCTSFFCVCLCFLKFNFNLYFTIISFILISGQPRSGCFQVR